MDKAIILNAGEGKRLRPLTELVPKCLLKLDGITILEHQLANLADCGIREVVIVIGYRADQIFWKVKDERFGLNIKFIQNPIFAETNTVYSLWLARNEIKRDFLYFNGDVIFHKHVLKRLINAEYDTCIAIDNRKVGEEEVKVQLISNKVKVIGKKIDPSKAQGEFIGIAKFSQKFNYVFVEKLDEVVKEGAINALFEVALDRALKYYDVHAVDVSDLPCMEIDSHEDFKVARKIYSKIIKETR